MERPRLTLGLGIVAIGVLLLEAYSATTSPVVDVVRPAGDVSDRFEKSVVDPSAVTLEATRLWPSFLANRAAYSESLPIAILRASLGPAPSPGVPAAVGHAGSDTGGSLELMLVSNGEIPTDAIPQLNGMLHAEDISVAGRYEAAMPIAPGFPDGPVLTVTVLVQDLFIWPLLALLLGGALAWWLIRRSDVERPREVLRAELRDAGERYGKLVNNLIVERCPYRLANAFPATLPWQDAGATTAETLRREISKAGNQETLDAVAAKVADLAQSVDALAALCDARKRLATQFESFSVEALKIAGEFPVLAEPSLTSEFPGMSTADLMAYPNAGLVPMITSSRTMLAPDAVELDTVTNIRKGAVDMKAQAEGVVQWLRAWKLLGAAQSAYEGIDLGRLTPEQRDALAMRDPVAFGKTSLYPTTDRNGLDQANVITKLREAWTLAEGYRRSQGTSDAVLIAGSKVVQASAGQGAVVASALEDYRSAAQIRADIERRDTFDFFMTTLLTALAYLLTLYIGKNFGGSPLDYLSAFSAGAAGQMVINWKLLPWYRSQNFEASTSRARASGAQVQHED